MAGAQAAKTDAAEVDVAVVGAGPVGSALALALADAGHGLRIAMIDGDEGAATPGRFGHDLRSVALNLGTECWLRSLGAWPESAPFSRVLAFDGESGGEIEFCAADIGASHLGSVVAWSALEHALRSACAPRVELVVGKLAGLRRAAGQTCLELTDGRHVRAGLVVGADGGRSLCRRLADIDAREHDYGQSAVVSVLELSPGSAVGMGLDGRPGVVAAQCFTRHGPLALLPLPSPRNVLMIYSVETAEAEPLLALDDAAFAARIGRDFEGRCGQVTGVDRRIALPLLERHAARYHRDGVVLVGDAAHTVHPLAGQGLNLGLRDVRTLAGELRRAVAAGTPLATPALLARYERRRRVDNGLFAAAMRAFRYGFGASGQGVLPVQALSVQVLRGLGMRGVAAMPSLRRRFARRAAGIDWDDDIETTAGDPGGTANSAQ